MNHARAVLWSMGQRYVPSLIHIVATLIITRKITPDDFGEVALVMTFYQIAILAVASGFGEGLMFRVKNSQTMLSSVFFFNLFVAILLYLVLFLISDILACYYAMPRLSILIKITSLNIILFSLSYLHKVRKQQDIDFKSLSVISIIASIIGSIIGIALAYHGSGVWSIVSLTLSINFVEMVLLWLTSKWHPSMVFSWQELKSIVPYSSKILLSNLIQVFYDNIYSLVIGKVFNAKLLGYFNRMQTVVYYTTTNFMYSVECVFFPVLCIKRNKSDNLAKSYENLLRLSTFLAFPILVILISLSKPIVVTILTDKWIEGADVLRLVATAYLFVPIIYLNNSFLKIENQTGILFYSNTIKKVIGIGILAISIFYGFMAVCYGVILYYAIDAAISIYCTHHYLGISVWIQLRCLQNNIIINLILWAVLRCVCYWSYSYEITFVLGTIIFLLFFSCVLKFGKFEENRIVSHTIKKIVKK